MKLYNNISELKKNKYTIVKNVLNKNDINGVKNFCLRKLIKI